MQRILFCLPLSWAACVSMLSAAPAFSPAAGASRAWVAEASDEGERAIKSFRVPPGLKVELVAAEPLLANPVAFAIDERGRFFVTETFRLHAGVTDIRGHMDWLDDDLAARSVEDRVAFITRREGARIRNYTNESDRVRLVVDTDGDGRADTASVFAEGFHGVADGLAAGVLARQGDVFFANIPHLWLLRDTHGNGVADFRKSLSRGYGVRVGFIGHDLHGLRFGPDGKLYFTVGDRGAHVPQPGGKAVEVHETGAAFRCHPDGTGLEVFASGLRNPQELAFDAFGNLWTGENNSDGGDPARWVHLVEGGDSGWRIGWQFLTQPNARGPWLSERLCYPQFDGQAAYILPPLANIGNGPSGLAFHPGVALNESFQDRFFLCDFRGGAGSGIHAIKVRPKGAGHEVVERTEFLWNSLVTDGDFGYDGCFYFTDWVNGWNKTGKGRIYRVFDPATVNSPAVREVKRLFAEGFAHRSPVELAALLAHADQRVRQDAQFALVARGRAGWPALKDALSHSNQFARLHAVWGAGQHAANARSAVRAEARRALRGAARHTDAETRGQAAMALGDARSGDARDVLLGLVNDPEPRPRFHAAIALGKLKQRGAVPALAEMLRANGDRDRYLRHAGVMGLTGCATPADLRKLASDRSSAVRMGAVLALRRQEHPGIADFLADGDPLVVLEAARAINDLPIAPALPALGALSGKMAELAPRFVAASPTRGTGADAEKVDLLTPLLRRVINARFRTGTAGDAAALVALAESGHGSDAVRAEALTALAQWAKPSGRDNVTGLWRPLPVRAVELARAALEARFEALGRQPATVKIASLKSAAALGLDSAAPAAFQMLSSASEPHAARVEALRALAALNSPRLGAAVDLALRDPDESVRLEATRIQARLRPGDALAQIRATLEGGSLRERQGALATLGAMPGDAPSALLAEWMDRLLEGGVSADWQLDVLDAAARRNDRVLQEKVRQFESRRDAADDLRSYRECLTGGDAAAGRKVFVEKVEVFCVRCHKAGPDIEGGETGPSLAGVGKRQTREYLLESIVLPNKRISPGFENVTVTMKNGAAYAGLLKRESETELEINSPEDGPMTLKKVDIQSRERGLSAMPEEFRQVLTRQELRNLVEFLRGLE